MPITSDPQAVAIPTFKTFPISMGDAYFKVTPREDRLEILVSAQFIAFDSSSPVAVSPGVRASAEGYLESILADVGGLASLGDFKGPKGPRIVLPEDYVVGDLINPYSGVTYEDVALIAVDSSDAGGKFFPVSYTFVKPLSGVNDGTDGSTILFNGTQIGDSGGELSLTIQPTRMSIKTTSLYKGPNPLTYVTGLSETLKLESSFVVDQPRGVAGKRSVIKSYAGTIGTVEWVGKGTILRCVLESIDVSEKATGIMQITSSFSAER